jgi:hypothetical protein
MSMLLKAAAVQAVVLAAYVTDEGVEAQLRPLWSRGSSVSRVVLSGSKDLVPRGLEFNADGSRAFVAGASADRDRRRLWILSREPLREIAALDMDFFGAPGWIGNDRILMSPSTIRPQHETFEISVATDGTLTRKLVPVDLSPWARPARAEEAARIINEAGIEKPHTTIDALLFRASDIFSGFSEAAISEDGNFVAVIGIDREMRRLGGSCLYLMSREENWLPKRLALLQGAPRLLLRRDVLLVQYHGLQIMQAAAYHIPTGRWQSLFRAEALDVAFVPSLDATFGCRGLLSLSE